MWIKRKDGMIIEFLMPGGKGMIPDGEEVDEGNIDLEDFASNYKAYVVVDGKLKLDETKIETVKEENFLNELRFRRSKECFPVINRGFLWYNNLTLEQKAELARWYVDWLNVTITKIIPTLPGWLA